MSGFLRDFAARRSEGLVGPDVPTCRKCGSPLTPIDRGNEWDHRSGEPGELRCSDVTCRMSDVAHLPDRDPEYDEAPAAELAERMRAALTRHDPLPGDRVRWHDGTFGVVDLVAASWLDPGEAVVYRDEAQAHPGAPTWCVEAGSLVAEAPDEAGAVLFVYRGSLR